MNKEIFHTIGGIGTINTDDRGFVSIQFTSGIKAELSLEQLQHALAVLTNHMSEYNNGKTLEYQIESDCVTVDGDGNVVIDIYGTEFSLTDMELQGIVIQIEDWVRST